MERSNTTHISTIYRLLKIKNEYTMHVCTNKFFKLLILFLILTIIMRNQYVIERGIRIIKSRMPI